MKRYNCLPLLLWSLVLLLLSSCTHNNGDIGELFGNWRLDRLTADGVEVPLYDGAGDDAPVLFTWAFQSRIIRITAIYSHSLYNDFWGTWEEQPDVLELNFTYSSTDANHVPPEILHLNDDGITVLTKDSFYNNKMELSYVASDGKTYKYYLSKPY